VVLAGMNEAEQTLVERVGGHDKTHLPGRAAAR
jgi:hypothetical protein